MKDLDCPIYPDDALGRHFIPLACFLYRFANHGHALEASIGIPSWMRWYSTPDQYLFQLWEAGLAMLLTLFVTSLLLARVLDERGLRSWDFKADARLVAGIGLVAKLEMCLVSPLAYKAGCVLEKTSSTDELAFQMRMAASSRVQIRPGIEDGTLSNVDVIYTLCVLPVLFLHVDYALCWFTSKPMISDLSRLRRFVRRAVLSYLILFPTAMLIMVLKTVLDKKMRLGATNTPTNGVVP